MKLKTAEYVRPTTISLSKVTTDAVTLNFSGGAVLPSEAECLQGRSGLVEPSRHNDHNAIDWRCGDAVYRLVPRPRKMPQRHSSRTAVEPVPMESMESMESMERAVFSIFLR